MKYEHNSECAQYPLPTLGINLRGPLTEALFYDTPEYGWPGSWEMSNAKLNIGTDDGHSIIKYCAHYVLM